MARWRRFRRGPGDTLVVSLGAEELELLQSLPDQLRSVLEGPADDPARARMFPRAYLDPTAEAAEDEWQQMVHPELMSQRVDSLALIAVTLDRAEPAGEWSEIALSHEEVQAWLGVLNDTRLVLGTRLGVTEDDPPVDPADPRAAAFAMYHWLTHLQGELIETLL